MTESVFGSIEVLFERRVCGYEYKDNGPFVRHRRENKSHSFGMVRIAINTISRIYVQTYNIYYHMQETGVCNR